MQPKDKDPLRHAASALAINSTPLLAASDAPHPSSPLEDVVTRQRSSSLSSVDDIQDGDRPRGAKDRFMRRLFGRNSSSHIVVRRLQRAGRWSAFDPPLPP